MAFNDDLIECLPRLRAYAVTLTRNRSTADDLLQETAFRALRARDQFQPGTNFKAWMYRILRNEYISSLRRGRRTPTSIDVVPESFFARAGDQEDVLLSKEVIEATNKLAAAQREVLLLVCGCGLNYEEAAQAIGCSIGTIKSRLWRARRHMQVLLGEGNAGAELEAEVETEAEVEIESETPAFGQLPIADVNEPAVMRLS